MPTKTITLADLICSRNYGLQENTHTDELLTRSIKGGLTNRFF